MNARHATLLVLLILATIAACDDGTTDATACATDNDCKGTRICEDGVCIEDPTIADTGAEISQSDVTTDLTEPDGADEGSNLDQHEPETPDTTAADTAQDLAMDTAQDTAPDVPPMPTNILSSNESYPQGLVIIGDHLYWTNHVDGGCVRRAPLDASSRATNVACETGNDNPMMVVPFVDGVAWTYMTSLQSPTVRGFGGVRVLRAGGQPTLIKDGVKIESSSSQPYCNDSIAALGERLFWTHDLQATQGIGRYSATSGTVDALNSVRDFPDGLVTTPTRVYFSAGNQLQRFAPDAPAGSVPTEIADIGSAACAVHAVGETVYMATNGAIGSGGSLYVVDPVGVEHLANLSEPIRYMASDATHLYFATQTQILRAPLTEPTATPELLHISTRTIGGLAVSDTHIYWSEYTAPGTVQRMPRP